MHNSFAQYQQFLDWLITNPSLVDVRKIRDYAVQSEGLDDALSFAIALIKKSHGKRERRNTNISNYNQKQHTRINA